MSQPIICDGLHEKPKVIIVKDETYWHNKVVIANIEMLMDELCIPRKVSCNAAGKDI